MGLTREARLNTVVEQTFDGSYFLYDPQTGQQHIAPDSTEWFVWLDGRTSLSFKCQLGHFTARKELRKRDKDSQGGSAYWYAYQRAYRKLHKRYLGTTEKLTLALLEETAQTLHEEIMRNLPPSQLLTVPQVQKPPPPMLTLGSLLFQCTDGDGLSIKTASERHFLTRTQAADLLRFLYDQQKRFLG